jgi:peptidoglycan/xylan/chitin deacetylase (PgdA/CDA1 family)
VGAHTVNHLALPDQAPDVQQRELADCARALERVLGRGVETFAFPYGAVDRASADLARVNYRWSVSCEAGPVGPWFDAARVPRLEVRRWDPTALKAHLAALVG